MSLLKTNEIQNYNGSSLTLTASTVSTSAQLNTGGNISVTGSLNVSDDSTTRTNLGLGTIATQDSDSITVTGGTATLGALTVSGSDSGNLVRITQTGSGNALVVEDSTNPDSTPFVVNASGNVGVGLTNPGSNLSVSGSTSLDGAVVVNESGADVDFRVESDTTAYALFVDGTNGQVGINSASPRSLLSIQGTSTAGVLTLENSSSGNGDGVAIGSLEFYSNDASIGGSGVKGFVKSISEEAAGRRYGLSFGTGDETSTVERMRINAFGNVTIPGSLGVVGSLTKGSGSFKIDHPLKPETHYLIHSFIEGPQADNIYRGKVQLVDGRAEVNIDATAGMTDGTFVSLNREVQCFTSNESGWTAVKGFVSGNILTITAQDETCTDTISWLVIGERQDQHMYDTDWTDENGKVIVEPEKTLED